MREPEVYPIQVQGPKSKDVMRTLFGDAIDGIRYYWTLTTELDGIPVVISRTGWTGEVGYEIYLRDPSRGGDLWDRVMEAGKPHDIRPIAPCEARRIEAGIFNYGSDITIREQPVRGHGPGAPGRAAGGRLHRQGGARAHPPARASRRSSSASRAPGDALPFELAETRPALHRGEAVGTVTDLIWSPRLERTSATSGCRSSSSTPGTELEIVAPDGSLWPATSAAIPFLDAKKDIPKG